jgi:hypothetical protein
VRARGQRIRTADQLVRFVDACGFCFAFTLRTGDAPIPACFDHLATADESRKWEWMWGWKDRLPEENRLYYGVLLARKPTFVALRWLPLFYATFGRPGEIDDHLEDVRAGRLTETARRIVDFLIQHGETQTKRMRAAMGITSKEGKGQYDKAVDTLQQLMYVTRVRAVGEGREQYNYTYDLFVRRYPEAVREAERLNSGEARTEVLARAVELCGGATVRQLERLFNWDHAELSWTLERLEASGRAIRGERGREAFVSAPMSRSMRAARLG